MVNSSFMEILKGSELFAGLAADDPHVHIDNFKVVRNRYAGRPHWEMDIIGLRLFSLSLNHNIRAWFNELPYISIYTSNLRMRS